MQDADISQNGILLRLRINRGLGHRPLTWCYALDGGLTAIPFRRGIRGQGGMGPEFDMAAHGLRRLKLGAVNGAWFGTLAEDGEIAVI